MTLAAGTKLGPYEILSPLGAGGMGEVYRARDARLNRDVALKVLPEVFSKDAERMARFEREAQVLASLNHPNIAALYGLEESNGVRALVMELVEGPTLAERIGTQAGSPSNAPSTVVFGASGKSGAIPLDEALPIAKQMAEALEYAHERGVVHRDLKPANIKVTREGQVKILDFGLAKALDEDPIAGSVPNSPTMSLAATRAGVILGTAGYMSPEQARGNPVDRRADIWAFGVVLFETLAGRQIYSGETVADILASVMKDEPEWDALPSATPPAIRKLLRRCLRKDPRQRLQAIGEARITIGEALSGEPREETFFSGSPGSPPPRRPLAWITAAIFALAAFAVSAIHFRETPPAEPRPIRFSVSLPERTTMDTFSLSPDGRYLAVALSAEGKDALWLRPLDALEAQRLPGTDDARFPFWSPDSRFIGFFAEGKLKKIPAAGGPAQTLCDAASAYGAAWNQEGVIVFSRGPGEPIYRVSAAGGAPAAVAGVESGAFPRFASFLPDGRRFLYMANSFESGQAGIHAASLGSGPGRRILPDLSNAAYAPGPAGRNGHVLFARDETLMAQPFDPDHLETSGEPFPIAERVTAAARNFLYKRFSVSPAGVLAYWGSRAVGSQLVWLDREGKRLGVAGEPGFYNNVVLSPDQKKVAVDRFERAGSNSDVWVTDLARSSASRLTFGPSADRSPVWSPDGSRIAFSSSRDGPYNIYQKNSAGTGSDELVFKAGPSARLMDWSRDRRYMVYGAQGKGAYDLWLMPVLAGAPSDRKPIPFVQSAQFINTYARFSPDGRWLAYASNETGRYEVYVRPVPGTGDAPSASPSATGAKWQISTAGGQQPVWRADGKELFYLGPDLRLMAVPIAAGSAIEPGVPKALFQTHCVPPNPVVAFHSYDVTPDGRRFLINTVVGEAEQPPITVVINWQAGVKR